MPQGNTGARSLAAHKQESNFHPIRRWLDRFYHYPLVIVVWNIELQGYNHCCNMINHHPSWLAGADLQGQTPNSSWTKKKQLADRIKGDRLDFWMLSNVNSVWYPPGRNLWSCGGGGAWMSQWPQQIVGVCLWRFSQSKSVPVGEDTRKGQKQGLDPARDQVLEPSLGEKAPVLGSLARSGTQPSSRRKESGK